jgi:formiminotetrahydrofolate cyclodeaminase
MSPDAFPERLASPAPTPGGGAAAARVGLYAACLLRMVVGITLKRTASPGKAQPPPEATAELEAILAEAEDLSLRFEKLEPQDVAAFEAFLQACRLPRSTPQEREAREEARLRAALQATAVPLETLERSLQALELARKLAEISRTTPLRARSDLRAAVELSHAAFRVAELNVSENLPHLAPDEASGAGKKWQELKAREKALYDELQGACSRESDG